MSYASILVVSVPMLEWIEEIQFIYDGTLIILCAEEEEEI